VSLSRPWKALERRHAKRFPDGVRIWRQDFGEVKPDGECPTDTWDCKCYARFSVVEMYVKAEKKYREYNSIGTTPRRFHLCLFSRQHPRAGDFVLVRANEYADLVEKERQLNLLKGVT